MRILAIDYGGKRIGLASGDSEHKIAFPRGILENSPAFFGQLKELCKKESIDRIIVGLPLGLSGQESAQTKKTRDFVDRLRQEIVTPVELIDERLTSAQAEKISEDTRRRKNVDDIAASLLLEQYFQAQKDLS